MTVSEFVNKVGFKVKEDDVKKVNSTISDIKSTATKVLGAIGIGFSLVSIKALIEEFGQVNNQINFATQGLEEGLNVQDKILESANNCRGSYSEIASLATGLSQANKELFPIEDAARFVEYTTKLGKAAGYTDSVISSTNGTLKKVIASGQLGAGEFKNLSENAPAVINTICDRLGVTKAQLESMAKSGTVSAQQIKDAMLDSAGDIDSAFSNVDLTITDALKNIRNRWGLWLAQMDKTLGVTKTIAKVMVSGFNSVMSVLNKLRTGVVWLGEKLGGTERLLKLIGIVGGSLLAVMGAAKIINFLKTSTALLKLSNTLLAGLSKKTLIMAAVVAIIALIIDDFINFMKGNNSLLGEFFKMMGIDADAARNKIKQVFGELKNFLKNIWETIGKELQLAWNGIKKAASDIWGGIKNYFTVHGSGTKKSLLDAWNSIHKSLTEIWTAIQNALTTAFDKINSTLGKHGGSIEKVFNTIGEVIGFVIDAAIRLTAKIAEIGFDVLSGAVQFCADVFTGLVNIICDAVDFFAQHKTLTEMLAIAVGTLTAAIIAYNVAQAIKNAGGIVELAQLAATAIGIGALTVAETAHTVATTIATAATTAFGAAMAFLTSPITLIILAIGALIAIIVLCVKYWDNIKEAASKAWDWIKGAWSSVANWFNETVIQPVVGFFKGLWDGIVGIFEGIIGWVKDNWKTIVLFILNPFAGVFKYLYDHFEGFRDFVDGIVNSIKTFFANLWEGIKTAFTVCWNAIISFFGNVWENIKNIVNGAIEVVSNIISTVWDTVKNVFSTVWGWITGFFQSVWDGISSAVSTAMNVISNIITTIWDTVKGVFTNVWNGISSFFSGIWEGMKNMVSNVINGISSIVSNIFNSIKNTVGNIKNAIVNGFQSAIDWIKGLPSQALKWGSDIISNIAQGIRNAIGKVTDAVSSVANKIKSFLHFSEPDEGPLSNFHTYMPDMIDVMAKGISGGRNKIKGVLGDLAGDMSALASANVVSGNTLSAASGGTNVSKSIVQNVNINNEFNGDRAIQRDAAKAMDRSAEDVTSQLARGLAFSG